MYKVYIYVIILNENGRDNKLMIISYQSASLLDKFKINNLRNELEIKII